MGAAEKLLLILLGIVVAVALVNHAQLSFGSGPSGASFGAAYYGLVK